MNNLTFEIAFNQFVGIGVSWNRRGIFDYGWITLELPFFRLTLEWSPDDEAWEARYGAITKEGNDAD